MIQLRRTMSTPYRILKMVLAATSSLGLCPIADAASTIFAPSKDNTLYEDAEGDVSNGQGIFLYVGKTGVNDGFHLRRGLIAFDLAGIPVDAVVTSVTLTMFLSNSSPFFGAVDISLHTATRDWGEGASSTGSGAGGAGVVAQTGDATWRHNFFSNSTWTNVGGDFRAGPSATTNVDASNRQYLWTSGTLVSDVQGWVSNPSENFGWLIRGGEAADTTAQRFNSGENTSNPPRLTVTYDIVPEPSSIALCLASALLFAGRGSSPPSTD